MNIIQGNYQLWQIHHDISVRCLMNQLMTGGARPAETQSAGGHDPGGTADIGRLRTRCMSDTPLPWDGCRSLHGPHPKPAPRDLDHALFIADAPGVRPLSTASAPSEIHCLQSFSKVQR